LLKLPSASYHGVLIELVVDLPLGLLQGNDILLVLYADQGLFEPLPVQFDLPLLFEIQFINLFLLQVISNPDILDVGVEYDVFLLEEVPQLRPEDGVVLKYILEGDLLEHLNVEVALDDEAAEVPLLQRFLENVFLNCVYRNEPVDVHGLGLAYPMAPVLGLLVHGGVPVGVVEDHAVSASEVDSNASTAR